MTDNSAAEEGHQTYVYPVRSLLGNDIQPALSDADRIVSSRLSSDNLAALSASPETLKGSPKSSVQIWSANVPNGHPRRTSRDRAATSSSRKRSTNYRHFPEPATPGIFRSASTLTDIQSSVSSLPLEFQDEVSSLFTTPSPESSDLAEATATEFSSSSDGLPLPMPFNPSELGLVHLPPLPPSTVAASTKSHNSDSVIVSSANSAIDAPAMTKSSSCGTDGSQFSDGSSQLATFRFKHAETSDGHHVVTGREGKFLKCEDEPIRTPGAVQGFGVLIVVEEDTKQSTLVVRQVSENAAEILGLSPQYLFKLECFTDTLPESQSDHFWDNLQFLNDPDANDAGDNTENSPHVFLVTGWSEPGSNSDVPDSRRSWTCWCAAHRPLSNSLPGQAVANGFIILEFELERDTYNPLSTSSTPSSRADGVSSPAGSSSSDESSRGSSNTTLTTAVPGPMSSIPENSLPITRPPPFSKMPSAKNPLTPGSLAGLVGEEDWIPSSEDILESTTSFARPLPALDRLRQFTRNGSVHAPSSGSGRRSRAKSHPVRRSAVIDLLSIMEQVNEQFGQADNLDMFLKIVVGVIKDLTQFHRVMVYQFDEQWNGQVVAELVDWDQTHDLYKGLHFPASDIPAQARELYTINKVRLLYDRAQNTARIIARSRKDLETPLDMTHCYLRAMSPIHVKYLENMGVRSSMSVSIMAFGALYGLITCHSYGTSGMRVSFPLRTMMRSLSQSISRNIERLSYAKRLHGRKLINTVTSAHHPTGYIISNAHDLLGLFDADFGILVIGEGAKILGGGPAQEILIFAEYLRIKQFDTIQVSQSVSTDFPDLRLSDGLEVIAGLLYVPLSTNGRDFVAFFRRGQVREMHWAGKPYKSDELGLQSRLEPRKSFKAWSETVSGRCSQWTDEQLETSGVLALVYGKFIEVWRQKETAVQNTKITNILLSNASHEVRTPLNHIINYLELALNGELDTETRDNLTKSHAASKSLLFTINDLLDLTRLETGNEVSFNEPFDLKVAILEATRLYANEATRRNIEFVLDLSASPEWVVGDVKKIKTVVSNLTANALKYTHAGSITIQCKTFGEPEGLRDPSHTAVQITVSDTGIGIKSSRLEKIFATFEQVDSSSGKSAEGSEADDYSGVGLGLAVVGRIVGQLGGQLRVESKVGEGSQFSFLIPLALYDEDSSVQLSISSPSSVRSVILSRPNSQSGMSRSSKQIDDLVEALASNHMSVETPPENNSDPLAIRDIRPSSGNFPVVGSHTPIRPLKVDSFDLDGIPNDSPSAAVSSSVPPAPNRSVLFPSPRPPLVKRSSSRLRVLVVEDNLINCTVLAKRLRLDGHVVTTTTNGQEGLDMVISDQEFDCVLMDIQMPILDGFQSAKQIRIFEKTLSPKDNPRLSLQLNARIPIFAVSASLLESQRDFMIDHGMDGWILKPIDFKRLSLIMKGITDPERRREEVYHQGCSWEAGGWLRDSDVL